MSILNRKIFIKNYKMSESCYQDDSGFFYYGN
nr:MAG TPA_asm: hypothetical protein [Caudoviricetes sp.]